MSEFDPVALHRESIAALDDNDVLIAAYPGSGQALVGNILLEVGMEYFDPYTERRTPAGTITPVAERLLYRQRLKASVLRDQNLERYVHASGIRFIKTHLYPDDFSLCKLRGIILLVRDPRDAVHSYYNWRVGFSEEGEKGSFSQFLSRGGVNGLPPCSDWARFNIKWLEFMLGQPTSLLLRFEDLKRDGFGEMRRLLALFRQTVGDSTLASAIESSSFGAMRAHEDRAAGHANPHRIMRRGLVNEWKEWFGPEYWEFFKKVDVVEAARALGYDITGDKTSRRQL
jgi:hypothetical protein